jgi:IPTL-CTERM motif
MIWPQQQRPTGVFSDGPSWHAPSNRLLSAQLDFLRKRAGARRRDLFRAPKMIRLPRLAAVCGAFALAAVCALPAQAARIGVLANRYDVEVAADFNAKVPGHTFTSVNVSSAVPTLAALLAGFDAILLFEDQTFANATAVGDVVAAFANSGRAVVLGTFYDQDRSDTAPTPDFTPHGWGALESIDPNTSDGTGTPYATRTLNTASLVAHPLTAGITALNSAKYAGGNQAKPGTTVVANWTQPNARGVADPAIAFRVTGMACVIHVAIAPNYPSIGVAGVDFTGDFYLAWKNAADFAATGCAGAPSAPTLSIPTLSEWGIAVLTLLLAAVAFTQRRRLRVERSVR